MTSGQEGFLSLCAIGTVGGFGIAKKGRTMKENQRKYRFENRSTAGVVGYNSYEEMKKRERGDHFGQVIEPLGATSCAISAIPLAIGLIFHFFV